MQKGECMTMKGRSFMKVSTVLTVLALVGVMVIGGLHPTSAVADIVSSVPSMTTFFTDATEQISKDMHTRYGATTAATIDDLLNSQAQVLYMDKTAFESISEDARRTELLKSNVASGKVVLVMDMGPEAIVSPLGIYSPSMKSTTARYVVGMVYTNPSSGRVEVGGILVPVHAVLSSAVPDLAVDVIELCQRVFRHDMETSQSVKDQPQLNAGAPYWGHDIVITHLLENSPWGRYWESCTARKQENDGDGTYDYWGLLIDQETRSGYDAYPPSTWHTSRLWTRADVGSYYGQLLYHHDPTTTSAGSTATVNISLNGCSWSWSFPMPDVSCIDHSSSPDGWAEWEFVYSPYSNAGTYTFVSKPGISVRTANGYSLVVHRVINTYWYQSPLEQHFFNEWVLQF